MLYNIYIMGSFNVNRDEKKLISKQSPIPAFFYRIFSDPLLVFEKNTNSPFEQDADWIGISRTGGNEDNGPDDV